MTDNMKKFLEAVSKDEALREEFRALADSKDDSEARTAAIDFAASHGFTLTEDDFKPSEMTELTEDEMKAVAGGAACACMCTDGGEGSGYGISCDCGWLGLGAGNGGCGCDWNSSLGFGNVL